MLRPGGVLVRTACSLISSGTERQKVNLAQQSLLGKARERPDQVMKVLSSFKQEGFLNTLKKVRDRLDQPMPLGYSCAGEVMEVADGVDEFQTGDHVACGGEGYANHAEINYLPKNLCVKVPDGLPYESSAYATVGAIALQAVRQAGLGVGERAAVIGMGLVGNLIAQLLKTAGCSVVGVDVDDFRIRMAERVGADISLNGLSGDLENRIEAFSDGLGVDAVIISAATKSNDPIVLAGEISRDRGTVVIVGQVKMDIPWKLYYEKELSVKLSRSYGPGRYDSTYEEKGIDYNVGYVRWTEKRNMEEFLRLVDSGRVDLETITTNRIPIERAPEAYRLILEGKVPHLGVLLEYPGDARAPSFKIPLKRSTRPAGSGGKIRIGFIGAGKFAQTTLLPNLRKNRHVILKSIASAGGASAQHLGTKFGFEDCRSDYRNILSDPEIDVVVIATRHDQHATIACEALKEEKHVFVEKPLALTEQDLKKVADAWASSPAGLTVGFNRRFSALSEDAHKLFERRDHPIEIVYRVNSGMQESDSWYRDIEVGGGGILGEACHFIDFLRYVTGSRITRVFGSSVCDGSGKVDRENFTASLAFEDRSIGTIHYYSNGDPSYEKERVEIFGGDKTVVIRNFRRLVVSEGGRIRKSTKFLGDKGHKAELDRFVDAIRLDMEMPIPFSEIVETSLATLKILDSVAEGRALGVEVVQLDAS